MEDKRLKLDEEVLSYKKGFKWHILPYSVITNAYLRIEEVNGRLCCGVASFDLYFLVLKTNQNDLIKIEASSKEIVKEMLDELTKKNNHIIIGYKKEA